MNTDNVQTNKDSKILEALRLAYSYDKEYIQRGSSPDYKFFFTALESFLLNDVYKHEILNLFEEAKNEELAFLSGEKKEVLSA